MSHRENLYKILELDNNATSEDIKKSFRRLSLLNHPDKNENDPIKTEKFKQINKAYEILSNSEKRNEYDNEDSFPVNFSNMPGMGDFMRSGVIPIFTNFNKFPGRQNMYFSSGNIPSFAMNNSQMHEDLLNFFFGGENLFNNQNNQNNQNKNQNTNRIEKPDAIVIDLEIELKNAISGCTLPLEIERWIIENNSPRYEKETIYVNIPKGIDHNELITLEGKGNIAQQNTKGDIRIFVKVNNNTEFQRDGLNLIYKKTLTIKEMLFGYNFELKYIDGRVFKIVNDKCSDTLVLNFKKNIPKLGIKRDGIVGDLILEFTLNSSEKLTPEQIEKLKEAL